MVHRENIRQICFEDKYGYTTETETRQVQGYKGLISVERTNVESGEKATTHTRWAPTSYKCYNWSHNPYNQWIPGTISLLSHPICVWNIFEYLPKYGWFVWRI